MVKLATKQCEKSPTNAHFWIEQPELKESGFGGFKCKHCHMIKRFPTDYDTARRIAGLMADKVTFRGLDS